MAPDSFKGTFSASEVAEAIARGVGESGGVAVTLPLADGGEGTLETLLAALGGETESAEVLDPLGRPVRAAFGLAADGRTAVVEMAAASGTGLVAEGERDAEAASTYGTGQLILAAARSGAERILIGVGGSATTDGGAGCLRAIEEGGGLGPVELIVLCDVRTPWEDAPSVFGPQKGADPEQVERLEARMDELAGRLPKDPRGVERTGAAGGLSGGLWAVHDAELVSGADWILDEVGFRSEAAEADVLVTGEGRIDGQTARGKLVSSVLRRSAGLDLFRVAAVGRNEIDPGQAREMGIDRIVETPDASTMVGLGRNLGEMYRLWREGTDAG